MNRNESTLQSQVRQLNDYLEACEQSRWIADVMRATDAEGNVPDEAPILIRTEIRDITLSWPDGEHLELGGEPVDNRDKTSPLVWDQHALLKSLIGSQIESIEIAASPSGDVFRMDVDEDRDVRISPRGATIACA